MNRFLAWLMGKATQVEMGTSARTFRRNHDWCWRVEPEFTVTGEVFDEIQLDGTYLRGAGLGLLTAINGAGEVLNRQWCHPGVHRRVEGAHCAAAAPSGGGL